MSEPKETVAISTFKATCLAVLDRVYRTGKPVVVTRYGEPLAEVVPAVPPPHETDWLGAMRGTVRYLGDIVSPASDPEEWEVLRSDADDS